MSYTYKVYLTQGEEHIVRIFDVVNFPTHSSERRVEDTFSFPDNLLSFLYLNYEEIEPIIEAAKEAQRRLFETHEERYAKELDDHMNNLAKKHIYFEYVRIDCTRRLELERQKNYECRGEYLPIDFAEQLGADVYKFQRQLRLLVENCLDMDKPGTLSEKLVRFYTETRPFAANLIIVDPYRFSFGQLLTQMQCVDAATFTEVLYPKRLHDLIDYSVRQCIREETRLRVCKNCGKYFALRGRSTAEYCDRPFDEKGRTCKDVGAVALWTTKRNDDEVFKLYRREYKRRFAWIKAKRITQDEFYKWSEDAREKKIQCDRGEITLEEFGQWLKG